MDNEENGDLIDKLDETQKEELFKAYDESFDHANLISHEEVKMQHKKWLNFNT